MAYSGKFRPKNPHKYRGNINNIVWRSTWELKLLKYLDSNSSVKEYASEEIVIPYHSPIDNKMHKYYVDFYVVYEAPDKTTKKYLVEVKPHIQTIQPIQPKRITESYNKSIMTYITNQCKWKAAKKFCEMNGLEFLVLTEYHLFGKKV